MTQWTSARRKFLKFILNCSCYFKDILKHWTIRVQFNSCNELKGQFDQPMIKARFSSLFIKAFLGRRSKGQQLSMGTMVVVSDEGVFHLVVDIVMTEPETFEDLFPMLWECFIMPKC